MSWAPDYVTTADLKAFLRIDPADTTDDLQLAIAITAASRAIDDFAYRQFGQVAAPEARSYTPWYDNSKGVGYAGSTAGAGKWVITIDDLQDATGLTVSVTAGALTLFAKQPINAAQRGRVWTRLVIDQANLVQIKGLENEATVTAKFGWTAVPVSVKQATLLQASRFFKRRDAPFGVAGSPDAGSEIRLLARVDPDVAVVLRPYRRYRLAVG